MRSIEYMRRKNAIVFKETGRVLIPESQLVDIECNSLMSAANDATMCPYCIEYVTKERDVPNECDGCPMFDAGNGCDEGLESSTYQAVLRELNNVNNSALVCLTDIPALVELVAEWNNDLKDVK